MFNKTGVYIIENIVNGKSYIGSTKASFEKRYKEHLKLLRKDCHHSIKLQNAWNKYGEDSFRFRILEIVDKQTCRDCEQEWMDVLIPEYNMSLKVETPIEDYTRELRAKISRAHGGMEFEVYKDGILIGVYQNQSYCAEKLGLIQAKISGCLRGSFGSHRGYRFKYVGKDFSYVPKTRYKRPKGVFSQTQETKEKIKIANTGKKHSKATKEKISKSVKDRIKKGWKPTINFTEQDRIKAARARFNGILEVYKKGKLIGSFLSVKEAAEELELNNYSIGAVLCGRRKSLHGYTFFKKENKL